MPRFSVFDITGATRLQKGQGQGPRFRIFETKKWAKMGHQQVNMMGKRESGAASPSGRATRSLSALERPFHLIFSRTDLFYPKNYYIYDPGGFVEAMVAEIKNT